MYAYLFAQSFTGTQLDLDGLTGPELPVRFATVCYAGYAVFAALQGASAGDIAGATGDIAALGATGIDVALLTSPQMAFPPETEPQRVLFVPPKFALPAAEEAFVRARLTPGASQGFLQRAAAVPGVIGAGLVAGMYDALVECGAATQEELVDAVDAVRALAGLTVLNVSLAHLATES